MNKKKEPITKSGLAAFNRLMENFRLRLAHTEALPQLAALGVVSGFATGLIAVAFRLGIELPLETFLPGHDSEYFEGLTRPVRMLLPLVGAATVALIFHFSRKTVRDVGVGHVIERYQRHQARLPLRNAVLQFFSGIIVAVSGHSVGREGPAIHLGAATSSLLGQLLKLPNNSLRILVGCGVASAIAASFNTPLAGVILAMELVLMEYTIAGFIPIILAAVCGAVVSRMYFGAAPAFDIPALSMVSLLELPYLALCGGIVGMASAMVLILHRHISGIANLSLTTRLLIAGCIASVAAALVPQVMGIGYDTLELAMLGETGFVMLAIIVLAKMLVSSTTMALGIPGGIIGPTLVIGACLGGCLGIIGNVIMPNESAASGFYALVCMGAMMAGVLNTPLAALIALLELTFNPGILLPGMLVIVISCITARMTSRLPGIFLVGKDFEPYTSPAYQALNRVGVTSTMSKNFTLCGRHLDLEDAESTLRGHPEWIIFDGPEQDKYIIRAGDLSRFLGSPEGAETFSKQESEPVIDLLDIPAERWQIFPVHPRATLHEAMELIRQKSAYAVYVTKPAFPLVSDVAGIITRENIDHYYR